ncbi:MAG TPA: acyl-CoA dehydrogenase family protein, partial [Tepidiformaceae bacterium]|nr:acyl-CoA dehydrogenase family protein [Tepidiformaceae bacterium]
MDYELTESQRLLKRSAADFFTREYPLDRMREFRHDRDTNERELWTAMSAMGWDAAPFAEEVGGFPGSLMDAAVLLEEMGRAACASPYVHSNVAAGLALAAAGHQIAAAIAAGDAVVVPAPQTALSGATDSPDRRLNGTYLAVPWVNLATHYLVPLDAQRFALVNANDVKAERLDSAGIDCVGR